MTEAHPFEFGWHEVGCGADVDERRVVHPARVVVDVVVQDDQQPVAEPLSERLEARGVPAARDDPEPVLLRRRLLHEVDQHGVAGEATPFDVVHHRRLRAVDRVAQRCDQPHVGDRLLRCARRPGRVRGARTCIPASPHPRSASPFQPENCSRYQSVPLVAEPDAVVEELELARTRRTRRDGVRG